MCDVTEREGASPADCLVKKWGTRGTETTLAALLTTGEPLDEKKVQVFSGRLEPADFWDLFRTD